MSIDLLSSGGSLTPLINRELDALRGSCSDIRGAQRDLELDHVAVSLEPVKKRLRAANAQLAVETDRTKVRLGQLTEQRLVRFQAFRNLQVKYGVYRPAKDPDPLDTILIALVFILLEGGVTAAMLISDGKVEIIAGIAYGLIFALVNVVLGIVVGFFPLRHLQLARGGDDV